MTIKANELMVDDWVLWKGKPVQVASVSGVKYSFGQIYVTLAHCNDNKLLETHEIKSIQPVPLTPEILERNGFKYNPFSSGFFECKTEDGNISCTKTDYWLFYINDYIVPNHFNYVHELQNTLKLCGIYKEIVL